MYNLQYDLIAMSERGRTFIDSNNSGNLPEGIDVVMIHPTDSFIIYPLNEKLYSSILGKYINPETGEPIEEQEKCEK